MVKLDTFETYLKVPSSNGGVTDYDVEGLKPCPFCGGKARMSAWPDMNEYSAYCTKCGAVPGDYKPTQRKAVNAWNRRHGA